LDADVAEHLAKQPNVSEYIRHLIKQDMNLPVVSEADFKPGAPLYRIYASAKMFWKRKRNIDITSADFGGFPQQLEPSELEELFSSVEASLQFDVDNIHDQFKNQRQEALNYLRNAFEQNSLDKVYQKLYVHWLKEKQDDY
jgi:hypothetical protein